MTSLLYMSSSSTRPAEKPSTGFLFKLCTDHHINRANSWYQSPMPRQTNGFHEATNLPVVFAATGPPAPSWIGLEEIPQTLKLPTRATATARSGKTLHSLERKPTPGCKVVQACPKPTASVRGGGSSGGCHCDLLSPFIFEHAQINKLPWKPEKWRQCYQAVISCDREQRQQLREFAVSADLFMLFVQVPHSLEDGRKRGVLVFSTVLCADRPKSTLAAERSFQQTRSRIFFLEKPCSYCAAHSCHSRWKVVSS